MSDVYLVDGVRRPQGRHGGAIALGQGAALLIEAV